MSHLHVSGTIGDDGTFTPGRWFTASAAVLREMKRDAAPDHAWAAAALGANDEALAHAAACIESAHVCPGKPLRAFSAVLALPDATAAVVVRDGEREVFRRAVQPAVRVMLDAGPRLELRRGRVNMPLGIDGSMPANGAYVVPVWEATGRPPQTLGLVDLAAARGESVELDLGGGLQGDEPGRLSLRYFDGVRSVDARAVHVELEARPPLPVILAPAAGEEVSADGWLALRGRLDGDGNEERLEWLLDETPVALGPRAGIARAAAGRRTVTLRHGEMSEQRRDRRGGGREARCCRLGAAVASGAAALLTLAGSPPGATSANGHGRRRPLSR